MASNSHIEWTEATWNPVTGCTKISPGCKNCYADRMSRRLEAMGVENYRNGFHPTIHEHMLDLPLTWRKPRTIFVNSMSDLFHPDVPEEFILKVFEVMRQTDWHIYQILTKRSERLAEMSDRLPWASHIWMGVSVESREYTFRIHDLLATDAHIKFLSLEPLLGPIRRLKLKGIDWVIVGGESGPRCRPMEEEWVTNIRDQCLRAAVPFFFKQWGGVHKKKTGRELEGEVWNQLPATQQLALSLL